MARQSSFRTGACREVLHGPVGHAAVDHPGSQRSFDRRARKVGSAGSRAKGRNEKVLRSRSLPILRGADMFEGDAPAGVVLCEAAPGAKVELVGFFELAQISFESRPLSEQAKDAPLIQHID